MGSIRVAILTVCMLLTAVTTRSEENGPAEFVLVNAPYPPFVMPLGDPAGPGIDMEIALRVLERLGIPTTVRLVPFKRALAMLETGQADMTTSLSLRQERDAYLLWSEPYRTDTAYTFFTRKDSPFTPARLEDLRGKTVGMIRGFVYPRAFAGDPDIGKVEAPQMESLVEMLLHGRFDAIIVNNMAGRYELLATGKMNEVIQAPFEIRTPGDTGTVMGFSRARGRADLVPRFNAELRKMLADGTIRKIESAYRRFPTP